MVSLQANDKFEVYKHTELSNSNLIRQVDQTDFIWSGICLMSPVIDSGGSTIIIFMTLINLFLTLAKRKDKPDLIKINLHIESHIDHIATRCNLKHSQLSGWYQIT